MSHSSRRLDWSLVAAAFAALAAVMVVAHMAALAPATLGDTEVLLDSNDDGVVSAADGQAVTLTPGQNTLLASRSMVAAGGSASGVVSASGGSLFSLNSGVRIAAQLWSNAGGADAVVQGPTIAYFASGFVGKATIQADNTTETTSNQNSAATVTVVGQPVFRFFFVGAAAPLGVNPGPVGNPLTDGTDRIGNGDCGATCNRQADIIVKVEDANGTDFPNGVQGILSIDRVDRGLINGSAISAIAFSRSSVTNSDLDGDGLADSGGVWHFSNGDADGSGANDLQHFVAAQSGRGPVTFTLTLGSGTGQGTLQVTGPPASLDVVPRGVTAHTLTGAGADTAVFVPTPPFALGVTESVIGGAAGNDLIGIEVTARDADGAIVDVIAGAPTVTDITGATAISFSGSATSAAEAAGPFGSAGPNAADGAAQPGRAYAIGDGGGAVTMGDRTIQASYTPAGGTAVTGTAVVRQAGPTDSLVIDVAILDAQTGAIGPDQVASVTVHAASADGGIVGDGTVVILSGPPPGLLVPPNGTTQVSVTLGTTNGQATARLLPTGTDAVITLIASADGVTEVESVAMRSTGVAPVVTTVTLTADRTSLLVGQATTVRATVTRADGSPAANALGVWREDVALSDIHTRVVATDANGQAHTTFSGSVVGRRSVSFTVVTLVGTVVVDTAATASVVITVEEGGASGLTATSGFAAWIGQTETTGSALLRALPGAQIVWRWNVSRWEFFATRADGNPLPGAVDFPVRLGAILFIR